MKNTLSVILFILIFKVGFSQTSESKFVSFIKRDFSKNSISKHNTLIRLTSNVNHTARNVKYLGEFVISNSCVFNRKEATGLLEFLNNNDNYTTDSIIKSCAFIPTHVMILSNNDKKIIAYSLGCQQLGIFSSDLKKVEAVASLNNQGSKKFESLIREL